MISQDKITLKGVDWLRKYDPIKGKIEDIKTATLWKKKNQHSNQITVRLNYRVIHG